ncbi:MAG: alpha/beta hydrolase [Actinomycetota bacterium]|jgi:pimeloyl-ACP methyl ester carboxylesterase|nr:alpha/beta hydrolase [Actinomycetota bacterium]
MTGDPTRSGDRRCPVLLVHGQPGLGSDWAAVVHRLSPAHVVLAPDRPGYGASGPALGMRENADLLARQLAGHELPAVVVGHSYGAGIAIFMADRHPDLVAGLVLVAPIGGRGSVVWLDRALAAPIVGAAASVTALAISAWLGPAVRRGLSRLGVDRLVELARYFPDEHAAGTAHGPSVWRSFVTEQRALVEELPALRGAVARLHLPVVVVAGTRDMVVPARASARLAAEISGAELVSVSGAGHFLPGDAPGVVARAVSRLLRRCTAPG